MNSIKAYRRRYSLPLALLLLGLPLPGALAHHSRAMFEIDRTIEMDAVVTDVRWRSPHVFWGIEVANENGETRQWTIEGHSISGLIGNGWQQDSVKVGDRVHVVVNPNRDPEEPFALLDYFQHADGRIFYAFRPPAGAEDRSRANEGITPSTDFSGTWRRVLGATSEQALRNALVGGFQPPDDSILTAAGREQAARFDLNEDPALDCAPVSLPLLVIYPYARRWTRQGDRLVIEQEQSSEVRTVYFDRTVPPADYVPNELGFSTGRIREDGTLVIESSHFAATRWGSMRGVDSSEQKTVVEEYSLAQDGLSMTYRYTVNDPVYLAKPLIENGIYTKSTDYEFTHVPCDVETSRQHLQFE